MMKKMLAIHKYDLKGYLCPKVNVEYTQTTEIDTIFKCSAYVVVSNV